MKKAWEYGRVGVSALPPHPHTPKPRHGFSLIEVLVAVTILAMAFTVIWRTFAATLAGWERGSAFLESLHAGDFVVEQVVAAMRSAAYFTGKPGAYGFWLEARGGQYPRDEISWVTSSSAFLPPDSSHVNGLHRISLGIGDAPGESGDDGLVVKAWPYLAELEEIEPEEWFISSKVKGLECEVYDFENEDWDDEWEDTNSIPGLVRITVYLEPEKRYGEPVKLTRLIEIPMAGLATNQALVQQLQQGQQQGQQGQPAETAEGQPAQQPVPQEQSQPPAGASGGPPAGSGG